MSNATEAVAPPLVQRLLPLADGEPQHLLPVLGDQVVVLFRTYEVDDIANVIKGQLLLMREGAEADIKDVRLC